MTTTTATREDLLITAEELLAELAAGRKTVLLDIRHAPGGPSKRAEYEAGHLPGAHWVEIGADLSGPRTEHSGNQPLPEPAALQERVRRWGIDEDSLVVVTGETGAPSAARGWLVLAWAGVPDVRLLDGGIDAWTGAGGELVTEEPEPGRGTFEIVPGSIPTIDADGAAALARRGVLLDARGAKQYVGEPPVEGQPRQGHIPGAISAPVGGNLDETGRIRPAAELLERFAALGVTPGIEVGAYCGGGVAAAHEALVLRTLGIEAPVFVGSWSAWASDPSRPVAVGPDAG